MGVIVSVSGLRQRHTPNRRPYVCVDTSYPEEILRPMMCDAKGRHDTGDGCRMAATAAACGLRAVGGDAIVIAPNQAPFF